MGARSIEGLRIPLPTNRTMSESSRTGTGLCAGFTRLPLASRYFHGSASRLIGFCNGRKCFQ
jgi:hypothetical protein